MSIVPKVVKKAACSLVALAFALPVFGAAIPVLAAPANPDSITLHTVKVFQNIFETNDVLFVTSYDVAYTTEPDEPAKSTFNLAVYGTDGTTLIKSRPLNYYRYNVHSVYFTAAQAPANLTWGSEYKVRVMGNPNFFPMTEDVTMDTMTLSSWSWVEGAATASRDMLKNHCLDLAATLENEWGITLIITTPEKQVLNSTGRTTFLDAIPGLDSAVPDLFQVAIGAITVTHQERAAAYEDELTIESQLGTQVKNAFAGVGNYLGVSVGTVAWMWIGLFMVVVASIVFLNSGNTTASLLLTVPIALIGVWTGAIPMALLFTVGVVIVVYMGYYIYLRGM